MLHVIVSDSQQVKSSQVSLIHLVYYYKSLFLQSGLVVASVIMLCICTGKQMPLKYSEEVHAFSEDGCVRVEAAPSCTVYSHAKLLYQQQKCHKALGLQETKQK